MTPVSWSREITARLAGTPLFAGLTAPEVSAALTCLGARTITFRPAETLVRGGDRFGGVGVVVSGSVLVAVSSPDGAQHLFGKVGPGGVFGEDLLTDAGRRTARTVTAEAPGSALVLGVGRIVGATTTATTTATVTETATESTAESCRCELRARVVENLLWVIAQRNRELARQLDVVTTRSLRARVLRYLTWQSEERGGTRFTLDYSRAQLADLLRADRSALSRELSRMRAEGLIDFHRNSFEVAQAERTAGHATPRRSAPAPV